jgi:hypothetical protein
MQFLEWLIHLSFIYKTSLSTRSNVRGIHLVYMGRDTMGTTSIRFDWWLVRLLVQAFSTTEKFQWTTIEKLGKKLTFNLSNVCSTINFKNKGLAREFLSRNRDAKPSQFSPTAYHSSAVPCSWPWRPGIHRFSRWSHNSNRSSMLIQPMSFSFPSAGAVLMWQNHPNYMAHMCPSLSYRPLNGAHISHTIPVVCRVSLGNPESSIFYNSYRINMEWPKHYNIWYKNNLHQSAEES